MYTFDIAKQYVPQIKQIHSNTSVFQRICIIVIFSNFFFLNRTMFCDKKLKQKRKTH